MKYLVIRTFEIYGEVCTIQQTPNSLEELQNFLRIHGEGENNISINIIFKK